MFKEKKEFRLSGSIGGGEETSTKEIQAASSVTKNIALMSNILFAEANNGSTENNSSKGRYFDGAVGYYKDFKKYGVFELYAGAGTYKQHHNYFEDGIVGYDYFPVIGFPFGYIDTVPKYGPIAAGSADLSYLNYFIQPNYGFSFDCLDVSISTRISDLYFNKINNQITNASLAYYTEVEGMRKHRHSIVFEPAITIRCGWKNTKMQLQYAYTGILSNSTYRYETYNLSFGVNFSIAKRYWTGTLKE